MYKEFVDNLGIKFSDSNKMEIFLNHLKELNLRIKDNKQFEMEIEELMLKEISDDNIKISEKIITTLFKVNSDDISFCEIFLVATHLQMKEESNE